MRRREFITLLGAAAAGPLAARAQQPERMRLIGTSESDPEEQARLAAFLGPTTAIGLDQRPQRADRDEMRVVVESEWPELAHKLPPKGTAH